MNDYISREEALNAILAERRNLLSLSLGGAEHVLTKFGYNVIADLPAADVRPVVRARWITKEYKYGDPDAGTCDEWVDKIAEPTDYYAECSACGGNAGYDSEVNLILSEFCPTCGADMRGREVQE